MDLLTSMNFSPTFSKKSLLASAIYSFINKVFGADIKYEVMLNNATKVCACTFRLQQHPRNTYFMQTLKGTLETHSTPYFSLILFNAYFNLISHFLILSHPCIIASSLFIRINNLNTKEHNKH